MEMAAACKADMLYVARHMAAVGADGINFDTTASTGDAEFLATLETVKELAATTDLAIEVGMAAEIPIHANVGIGVGGVPLFEVTPPDVLTRCSAAMVEIGRVDGL